MRLLSIIGAGAALVFALSAPAHAAPNNEPATIGFGIGRYDVIDNNPHNPSTDFRLEYRAAYDMLGIGAGFGAPDLRNSVIAIRPFGGIETTTDGALYGLGGFVFDVPIGKHLVLSPNLGVGLYYMGDGKRLGSFVEFRSTMELGWRFDDGSRLTAAFGHISNAGLTSINHGVEIANIYYHIPFDKIFSK